MVLGANPVTLETAARPPHPAARISLAANNRRPRSSRFEPSASHRCRIASVSIMPTLVSVSRPYRDYPQLSHTVAAASTGSSDSLIVALSYPGSCPKISCSIVCLPVYLQIIQLFSLE
jgi:hypothetical protein